MIKPEYALKKIVDKGGSDLAIRYADAFPLSQLLFCSLIERFGKKRDIVSAIRAFEVLKEKSGGINMFAVRAIIDACGVCGDFQLSRRIFEELLAEKIIPNVYVMNSLMNVNAHDLSYTFQVFKLMQSLGITADMPSYNILLKACCNAERVDLAQKIYEEIKNLATRGALKLDVFTYSTMIKVFADAKMWQMAFSIKEDMFSAGVIPNVVTWSSLISAYTSAGLIDSAIMVFNEMLLAGCEPNAQCFNILLNGCIQSYQYDRAFRLFCTWKESGFMIQIATNFKENKDGDRFLTVVFPFRPSVATFNIMMKACGTDFNRANALMDEMKKMGITPSPASWSILIDIYGSAKNASGAIQVFREMRDVGIKPDVVTYTTMIKACIGSKKLEAAYSLYEEMKKFQIQPNFVTYNTLLRGRSRYGSLLEVQQCLSIYKDMRKAGYSPNDYYLKELIEEWCEGVLSGKNRTQSSRECETCTEISYSSTQHNVLLEKVAMHLQKDVNRGHAIDIRGLTQVEARIVVLSVLRMIKERHSLGQTIEDDVIISCGIGNEQSYFGVDDDHAMQVQHAITKLLQDDLGLDIKIGHGSPDYEHKFQARRPLGLGVLKVKRESLISWLQRRSKQ